MKHLSSNEIRRIWLSFWEAKEHLIVPSASLVPVNDKSILFINAGVAPLKKFFDGSSVPEKKRLVNVQKCIRTGDIESVGDTTHLTFFEMLGNFSIGNYFKEEAITWAYELLTSEQYYNFDPERLYFTVHPSDSESRLLWEKQGVYSDHIIELEGNYWEIGEGPSGPCSEIFYDRGESFDPNHEGITLLKNDLPNDRYVEIWNIVFSAFNAVEGVNREDYQPLPSKNIDTGMGLERMAMILQEVKSIYDTDLFYNLIKNIELISDKNPDENIETFRIIADHIRTVTMALKDGTSFGNNGRGYVIRRLLRRAIRQGYQMGVVKPFIYRLVPSVAMIMQDFYPFSEDEIKQLMDLVLAEEVLFHKTLVQGEERIKTILANPQNKRISGEDAFKLYDTYGFPLELTIESALSHNVSVDTSGFLTLMEAQRRQSKEHSNMANNMTLQNKDLLEFKLESRFIGYEKTHVHTKVIALFDKDGNRVTELYNGGYLVLEETPFYAESGGQVGDIGLMRTDAYLEDDRVVVEDVIKAPNGQHLHKVRIIEGVISQGEPIEAKIDVKRRQRITINHSAAHLLHLALKNILSQKVYQAGSYINDERIRFDFNFVGEITDEHLLKIEAFINEKITNKTVIVEEMPLTKAKANGAIALFDDKYGEFVRTIKVDDSFELCGGTHVKNILDIDRVAIISFESKGSNVYRIEAATQDQINILLHNVVEPYKAEIKKLLKKASDIMRQAETKAIDLTFDFDFNLNYLTSFKDVISYRKALQDLQTIVKTLEKKYNDELIKNSLQNLDEYSNQIQDQALIIKTNNQPINLLKTIMDKLSNEHQLKFIFIANLNEQGINFLCKINEIPTLDASALIKDASFKTGGSGGGNKTFAQGGGTDIKEVDRILANITKIYQEIGR